MNFSQLCTDPASDNDGIWVPYANGVKFKLRPIGCRKFDEAVQTRTVSLRKNIRNNTLTAEQLAEIQRYGIAYGCIVDWEGVTDDDGSPMIYKPSAGYKALTESYRLYKDLVGFCTNLQEADAELEKDAMEN